MNRTLKNFSTQTRSGHHLDATVDKYMSPMPHTIGREQTMAKAHSVMRELNIRHLPVLEGGRLVGLLSDRDLHFVETLKNVDPKVVKVDEAMTMDPYTVSPQAKLGDTVSEMANKKYGSAVVVKDGHVVGILTAVDAMHALAWILDLMED